MLSSWLGNGEPPSQGKGPGIEVGLFVCLFGDILSMLALRSKPATIAELNQPRGGFRCENNC